MQKIVIKIGTWPLRDKNGHLDKKAILNFAKQIVKLQKKGKKIILVSSGAVAAGREFLKLKEENKNIPQRQMLAAVGQSVLIETWRKAFLRYKIIVAQALLSKYDFINRKSYLNTRLTLSSLLDQKIIPIINENDVTATEELEFGDNDTLAAQVASSILADLLIILTKVKGLYTGSPKDPKSKLILEVKEITKKIENYAKKTEDISFGGMATKIEAAKLATASGCEVVIAYAGEKDILSRIISGEKNGTRFYARAKRKAHLRWILSRIVKNAAIIVDKGAEEKVVNEGKSLLPVGIIKIFGKFSRGDVIEILDEERKKIAFGLVNYSSNDLEKIKKKRSLEIERILGYNFGEEIVHRDNMVIK